MPRHLILTLMSELEARAGAAKLNAVLLGTPDHQPISRIPRKLGRFVAHPIDDINLSPPGGKILADLGMGWTISLENNEAEKLEVMRGLVYDLASGILYDELVSVKAAPKRYAEVDGEGEHFEED